MKETRPPSRTMWQLFECCWVEAPLPIAPKSTVHDTLPSQSWVGGRSFKEHAHNHLCSKMAKDNNFARVLKTTLPPTIARKLVTLTPLRSVPYHNLCGLNWQVEEKSLMVLTALYGLYGLECQGGGEDVETLREKLRWLQLMRVQCAWWRVPGRPVTPEGN